MGPYCKFCDRRCFVLRVLADGRETLLATCDGGMEHDRKVTGQDHTNALNPITEPEAVDALVAGLNSATRSLSVRVPVGDRSAGCGDARAVTDRGVGPARSELAGVFTEDQVRRAAEGAAAVLGTDTWRGHGRGVAVSVLAAVAGEVGQLRRERDEARVALSGHLFDGESPSTRELIRSGLLAEGLRAINQREAEKAALLREVERWCELHTVRLRPGTDARAAVRSVIDHLRERIRELDPAGEM